MKEWNKAEQVIYKYFSEKKGSYIYRFSDTHDINSQLRRFSEGRKLVYTEQKPSDFLVTENSITYFVEVKSTSNIKGITSALFKQQVGLRNRIIKANGLYFYFIYSTTYNKWYKISAIDILENSNRSWDELINYEVKYL